MFIKKSNLLSLILVSISLTSYTWANGNKLSDGSCTFDRETGYKSSSLYINGGNESFLIIDGGDSRYGTISTVYNAITCEEIASGDPIKSNFSGLMRRKGFLKTNLSSRHIIDKLFQHKITFLENSDDIRVHVEPIERSVTQELNQLLASLSDMSASSKIIVSDSAKELLGYKQFSILVLEKLNSLSISEINYDYALALTNKLNVDDISEDSKRVIFAKQKEVRERLANIEKQRLAKKKDEERRILAKQEAEKRKILAQQERTRKLQKVKALKRSIGRRVSWYGSHRVDTDDCVQLYFFKKCMWVTYKYKFQGVLKAVDESSYTIQVTSVQLSTPRAVSMKYMQFKQQGIAWGQGQQGVSKKVSIDTDVNIL
ncbi:hypothetical protein MNB_SV-14-1157 [hydrothermal vent metagenome]|uniref:Uncharacterized protein n=1 Tax=hydrothermal vent metagenome TaxID=652676 RepID=A0A1W1CG83_9ZZZZ